MYYLKLDPVFYCPTFAPFLVALFVFFVSVWKISGVVLVVQEHGSLCSPPKASQWPSSQRSLLAIAQLAVFLVRGALGLRPREPELKRLLVSLAEETVGNSVISRFLSLGRTRTSNFVFFLFPLAVVHIFLFLFVSRHKMPSHSDLPHRHSYMNSITLALDAFPLVRKTATCFCSLARSATSTWFFVFQFSF